ncbi:MAG: hypothetical protein E6K74_03175 [Candidatus Eisenbacteria bacterium]|uniref:DUF4398 domain-containing protein n=1 Tax=Eiseniibacteriota bacterium TaxID=2212470 RepID=A0A538SVN5_UNCEI|nr:MAG: hypothetical protein E6K74_03175 [Candidatus Eisenbacteria bacterium]
MRTAWLVAALLAGLAASSCQWAGDTKAVRVSFSALKDTIEDVSARLDGAVEEGSADRVPAIDRELNTVLDTAEKQSSAMNILDREHLAISIATARQCISAMDRYAQSGDSELLRAQNQQLQPTIKEIQELLERADRTTTAK